MDHVELKNMLPAYALEILAEDETRQVQTHLVDCPECRAELRAYFAAVHHLALAAPQLAPPPRLKGAILARVRPARSGPGWAERWQGRWRSLSPAWGLAGLALVLLLAVSNIVL